MPLSALLFLTLSMSTAVRTGTPEQSITCATWQECRDGALAAADRRDYEAFHDLAWRAMQKGPKNDPALMTMLARAQSLSGRPGDALVMLQRLTAQGVHTDAASSEDFRRVRALPGWAQFSGASSNASDAERRADDPGLARSGNKSAVPTRGVERSADATNAEGSLVFSMPAFIPGGLAHDAVSDRFIVADRADQKLAVIDEASHRVANLARAESAGFGTIEALEIDSHEGDLWVASTASQDGTDQPTLHKLQLISGRVLYALQLPRSFGAARFTDLAVAPHSTIFALDVTGHRLFQVRPKARTIELSARLKSDTPVSIAAMSDSVVYVADNRGITRLDLTSRGAAAVKGEKGTDLTGLMRIRWYRGTLVGVQKSGGAYRIVRIRLDDRGVAAVSLDVLDAAAAISDPAAVTVSGDTLFYVADRSDRDTAAERLVKRVSLRTP